MTLYDSSVLINYLDGDAATISYVDSNLDERSIAPPLVLFEVYQGEVFKTGPADFDAVNRALGWLSIVDSSAEMARGASELQSALHDLGTPLAARDAFIAGSAKAHGERLAVADADFDVDGITDLIDIDFL